MALWLSCPGAASAQPVDSKMLVETVHLSNLSLSPKGDQIAFLVMTSSVQDNAVRGAWTVMDLQTGRTNIALAVDISRNGFAEQAVWSRRGDLYIRGLAKARIGLWRSAAGKAAAQPIVNEAGDVISFKLSEDERQLTYVVGPDPARREAAERQRYLDGILVDGGVMTAAPLYKGYDYNGRPASLRREISGPQPLLADATVAKSIELPLTGDEQALRGESGATETERNRWRISLRPVEPDLPDDLMITDSARPRYSRMALSVTKGSSRQPISCKMEFCTTFRPYLGGAAVLGNHVAIVSRADHGSTYYRIDLWDPARNTARRIYAGGLITAGSSGLGPALSRMCPVAAGELICIQAAPVEPPRIVAIGPKGNVRTLFDPNSALRERLKDRRIEQIDWSDPEGRRATGWLLYPVSYQPGTRYPLVITSYRCAGFLAGTADTPEHVLTQDGFMVLCADSNSAEHTPFDSAGQVEVAAMYRKQVVSWGAIIDRLADKGMIDRARVGVAGVSFSAIAASYGMSHSKLFAAVVSRGSGNLEPSNQYYYGAPGNPINELSHKLGVTPVPYAPEETWRKISTSMNARDVDAAYLIQSDEVEFRSNLPDVALLTAAKKPVELIVYPNEFHTFFEPAHKLKARERSRDWFRFWLAGQEDGDMSKAGQYARWRLMRTGRDAEAKP